MIDQYLARILFCRSRRSASRSQSGVVRLFWRAILLNPVSKPALRPGSRDPARSTNSPRRPLRFQSLLCGLVVETRHSSRRPCGWSRFQSLLCGLVVETHHPASRCGRFAQFQSLLCGLVVETVISAVAEPWFVWFQSLLCGLVVETWRTCLWSRRWRCLFQSLLCGLVVETGSSLIYTAPDCSFQSLLCGLVVETWPSCVTEARKYEVSKPALRPGSRDLSMMRSRQISRFKACSAAW